MDEILDKIGRSQYFTTQKFPLPKSSIEIKLFLGLCCFHRKFIPNFAKIAKPITQKTKKGFI